jgi:hypothetical protein
MARPTSRLRAVRQGQSTRRPWLACMPARLPGRTVRRVLARVRRAGVRRVDGEREPGLSASFSGRVRRPLVIAGRSGGACDQRFALLLNAWLTWLSVNCVDARSDPAKVRDMTELGWGHKGATSVRRARTWLVAAIPPVRRTSTRRAGHGSHGHGNTNDTRHLADRRLLWQSRKPSGLVHGHVVPPQHRWFGLGSCKPGAWHRPCTGRGE